MTEMPFVDFYARLVDGDHGVERGLGAMPRGFYTEGQPGHIRLMAVLLNPAQPHADEVDKQEGVTGAQLAQRVWDASGHHLKVKSDHRAPTLDNLRSDVEQLFGRPIEQCLDVFMFTNLVRITTVGNQPPDSKTVKIGAGWLREEIALWRPDKVLAYGNDAALGMLSHGIRVDAMLPHPAARGSAGQRRDRVAEIRQHLGLS